jgi:CBS domain-containing protein
MARNTVADVMTRRVVYLPAETTVDEAAQAMRDEGIGDVVVTRAATLAGLVTDRDIVVRVIASGLSPKDTTLGDIATHEIVMVAESASLDDAVQAMRERSIRRLLVCDADRNVVGIVSLGDIAMAGTTAMASGNAS